VSACFEACLKARTKVSVDRPDLETIAVTILIASFSIAIGMFVAETQSIPMLVWLCTGPAVIEAAGNSDEAAN